VHKNKFLPYFILCLLLINIMLPISVTYAAPLDNIVSTLAANTMDTNNTGTGSSGLFQQLFDLVFNKILGPVFNIFSGSSASNPSTTNPGNVKPLPPTNNNSTLKNKVIVVDPDTVAVTRGQWLITQKSLIII
jgi:N-acetylmuramoyl-L-alanine amidase